MNIQRIIEDIRTNDEDRNRNAMQSLYTEYSFMTEKDIVELVPSIIYYLWKLPKFSVQRKFIVELLDGTDEVMRVALLKHVISIWDEIQLVRMDKFYYLIKKLLEYYPLDIKNISYLFNVTHNIEIKAFIVRCIVDRLSSIDEDLEDFLAEFTSKCLPAILFSLESLRFRKEIALKYATSREVGKKNRLALYSMIK